jgi:hypothetical protein
MQKARLNIQLFGSGTIDGSSTASNCDCRIVWNSTKIDSDNSSLVEMTTQIKKSGSSSTTGTFNGVNTIDGTEFSVSKKNTWAWGDWRTVATSSKTVKHNDDGTKQIDISTLLTQNGTTMAGTYRASGTITLDTINRASRLQTIGNFDLNDTIIIGINKYVTSAVDTLQIKIGDTLIREVTNIANGYELTFNDTEKTTINSLSTSPQVSLIFLLTTVNGETVLGTSTQSVLVTLLDKSMFREIYQKENGKYQVAINGLVNTNINDVLQVYDDNGNLINNNQILWGPDYYFMSGSNTINLSQKVSEQKNGIVLVWQAYSDNAPQPWDYNFTFIPKWQVITNSSRGVVCYLATSHASYIGTKYVYLFDDKIKGYNNNSTGATKGNSGITTTNNHWVLTYVIGV